jgi:hypothetical protein
MPDTRRQQSKIVKTHLCQMLLETRNTKASQDEPQFDAAEASTQSDLPVPVINHGAGIAFF